MGIVNQLKIGGGNKTVSDLADQFVLKVITESSGYGTVMLVFDNYVDESEISLAQTWLKRYKDTGVVVEYKLTPRTEITNYIKLKDLLSHKSNKKLLCKLLAAASIKQLETYNKQYIVAYDQIICSNITAWSMVTGHS